MKLGCKRKEEDLSIVSAVEALSNIADLEFETLALDQVLAGEIEEPSAVIKTVRWLHKKNAERMVSIIRNKMRVVLNYLRHFYKAEKSRFARSESVEGIRTIMLLVDEAAVNLDRYTKLFLGAYAKSVKQTREFLALCAFYKKKILPIAAHTKVARWISAFPVDAILESAAMYPLRGTEMPPVSILGVELEGIKEDRESELLFLRQPNGSRFFSPKLLRALKLAADVERATGREPHLEEEIRALERAQSSSEIRYLLGQAYPLMDAFFHMALRAKDHAVYFALYKACVALLEASVQAVHRNPKEGAKSDQEYFRDFADSLNELLHRPEFQRMLAYPPHNEHSWEYSLFRLVQAFSSALIAGAPLSRDFVEGVKALAKQALENEGEHAAIPQESLSQQLAAEAVALRSLLKVMKGDLLSRMVQKLDESGSSIYEPLLGESVPTHLFDISWRGALIPVVRLPSPTRQEYVHKARISEIFHIAIARYLAQKRACLVINLQDRTSWRESARSLAIEEFCRFNEEGQKLYVLSQNRSGSFYEQTDAYEEAHLAEEFKEELLSYVIEAGRGSLWPISVDEKLTKEARALIQAVHTLVYGERNVITRVRRLEFIELIYNLMIMRAIGTLHPDVIFVSCKDGLDVTLSTMSSLFCTQAAIQGKQISQHDADWLRSLLFGIPLVYRKRMPFPERQERMTSFLRFIENTLGSLGKVERRSLKEAISAFLPNEIMNASILSASGHKPAYPESS